MSKRISLLGATGSIGIQTLDIIREHPNRFHLVAFSVGKNIEETKNTTITFEDISSNDGTNLINIGNKSINIKVEVEKQPIEEPRNEIENEVIDNILGEENEIVENNTQTENKVTQNNIQNNNTHSNTKLPSTGIEDSIMPLIVIGVIIAIGLGMKCRKWRDIK